MFKAMNLHGKAILGHGQLRREKERERVDGVF